MQSNKKNTYFVPFPCVFYIKIVTLQPKINKMDKKSREKSIYHVTLVGSFVNMLLVSVKFAAGIFGHSSAMIADAVHSLSDFLTDIIVLLFVRLSSKPEDSCHDYGHGKYETLATVIIGVALLGVGINICYNGIMHIIMFMHGHPIPQPGVIALAAALVSILSKEWIYRYTIRVGKRVDSQSVIANAWHHRSDALSSVGTALGIGGALLLGARWSVLDPIAAVVVSVMIVVSAVKIIHTAGDDLLERSLPQSVEDEIVSIASSEPSVSCIHHLRTRRIGSRIAIDMHLRMPAQMTLYESHAHTVNIERRLRERFGQHTYIGIHAEPEK